MSKNLKYEGAFKPMEPFKRKRNVPRGQQKDNISVWSRKKYFSSSMNAERLDIILPIVGSNMNE